MRKDGMVEGVLVANYKTQSKVCVNGALHWMDPANKDNIYSFDIELEKLKSVPGSPGLMNVPRCLFGKESLEEIAIFAGSCVSQCKILSSAELYNSETGTWRTSRSMNKPSPPLVAAVNNQFTLLTMLKCRLGSMKSITKNGFIEVNSWYIVKDLKNGICSAKSNQVALCTTVLSWDAEVMECGRSHSSAHGNSFESAPPMPPIT
ncbi:F-box/kelch-repeat protein SKIP11 [Capsicum chinense]|nr:F-box/kelch-repeat protein SKIP11 [Capsicum chinense]